MILFYLGKSSSEPGNRGDGEEGAPRTPIVLGAQASLESKAPTAFDTLTKCRERHNTHVPNAQCDERLYVQILFSKSKDYILDSKTGPATDEDTEYHYKYTTISSNSVYTLFAHP